MDEDIFTVTQRLAMSLRRIALLVILGSVPGLIFSVFILAEGYFTMFKIIAASAMWGLLAFGIFHAVVASAVLTLKRWAMQAAMVLGAVWVTAAVALAVLLALGGPTIILLPIPALIAWAGVRGVRRSLLAIRRLNEDDGFTTDEPIQPKGFSPILTTRHEPPTANRV